MDWSSAAAKHPSIGTALDECIATIRREMDGRVPDLVMVYATHHFGDDRSLVAGVVQRAFPDAVVVGGSLSGVIGGGQELEDTVAVSMCAAHLPDVAISPFQVSSGSDFSAAKVGVSPEASPALLLMSTPGIDVSEVVHAMSSAYPSSVSFGGVSGTGEHLANCTLAIA